MPHVIVKMYKGRSEKQKKELTEKISSALSESVNASDISISVSIEEFSPDEWVDRVYKVDILPNMDKLYKKPGYDPMNQ